MNAIGNLIWLLFICMTALPIGPASAQPTNPSVDSPDAGKLPALSLRTRIPLPGVYGRIDVQM